MSVWRRRIGLFQDAVRFRAFYGLYVNRNLNRILIRKKTFMGSVFAEPILFVGKCKMDSLKKAALVFQELLDCEYEIVLGKKKKLYSFVLEFRKQDFFHLAGLQYLKDIPQLKKSREVIFDEIINGILTEETIKKSCFFSKIEERIEGLSEIEKILDSNETVFRFYKTKSSFSNIDAEYFLETKLNDKTNYIFIDRNLLDKMFCRSFFFNDTNEYRINQIRMFLLKKEKKNKRDNSSLILIDKLQ